MSTGSKREKEPVAIELTFYEVRREGWRSSTVVYTYLDEPISKAVKKAAESLGIKADQVALITPSGVTVQTRDEEGRELTVKDVVEKYGFTYGIVPRDLLGGSLVIS